MRPALHDTLKSVGKDEFQNSPLTDLYIYKEALLQFPNEPTAALTHLLHASIDELALSDEMGALIIRRHFFNNELIQNISRDINMAEGTAYNRQSAGITTLAGILERNEEKARDAYFGLLEAKLPHPMYGNLVGIDHYVEEITGVLTKPDGPSIVALVGIGGIGKTSLAHYVMRALIHQGAVSNLAWITAKAETLGPSGIKEIVLPKLTGDALMRDLMRQLMPEQDVGSMRERDVGIALGNHLNKHPHLIAVDNLETAEDIEAVLDTLKILSNPSKFLITTRKSLYQQMATYNITISQLSDDATIDLIRQEVKSRNLHHLQGVSDEDLKPLLEIVGGNPLALQLVLGQTQVHPLSAILDNLRMARGEEIEDLYTYIYRQAWDSLNENARRVLLVMPLVANDAPRDYITKISQLEPVQVGKGIEQLVKRSLIEVSGTLNERFYTIHSLTRTFLHEQVIRWQA